MPRGRYLCHRRDTSRRTPEQVEPTGQAGVFADVGLAQQHGEHVEKADFDRVGPAARQQPQRPRETVIADTGPVPHRHDHHDIAGRQIEDENLGRAERGGKTRGGIEAAAAPLPDQGIEQPVDRRQYNVLYFSIYIKIHLDRLKYL